MSRRSRKGAVPCFPREHLGETRLTRLLRESWLASFPVTLWLDDRCDPKHVQGKIAEVTPTGALVRMENGVEVPVETIRKAAGNAGSWERVS
jgi:hypothetical protein